MAQTLVAIAAPSSVGANLAHIWRIAREPPAVGTQSAVRGPCDRGGVVSGFRALAEPDDSRGGRRYMARFQFACCAGHGVDNQPAHLSTDLLLRLPAWCLATRHTDPRTRVRNVVLMAGQSGWRHLGAPAARVFHPRRRIGHPWKHASQRCMARLRAS